MVRCLALTSKGKLDFFGCPWQQACYDRKDVASVSTSHEHCEMSFVVHRRLQDIYLFVSRHSFDTALDVALINGFKRCVDFRSICAKLYLPSNRPHHVFPNATPALQALLHLLV